MPPPLTVVFDLDGTLVDTAPDLAATMNVMLARRGRGALPLAEVQHAVGLGAAAIMRAGMAATGASADETEIAAMVDEFVLIYAEGIARESRPFPGAVAAMDRLEAAGCRLAMCTNKREHLALSLLAALGLEGRFATVLGGDSLDVRKPHPRHLIETIERSAGDVGRAVLVGDSITDIDTARAARVPVIGVSFGYSDPPIATLGPDRVIDHFDELPRAIAALFPEG